MKYIKGISMNMVNVKNRDIYTKMYVINVDL
jgi:hypothetical protein